jgi:hypothetical protein
VSAIRDREYYTDQKVPNLMLAFSLAVPFHNPIVSTLVLTFRIFVGLTTWSTTHPWPHRHSAGEQCSGHCARDITLLHRSYGPLRHPVAFDPFPVSAVIGPSFSEDFSPGHRGLLQFLSSPCYRVAANTPPVWAIPLASVR